MLVLRKILLTCRGFGSTVSILAIDSLLQILFKFFHQVAAKLLHGEVPEQSPDEQRHWHR